MKKIILIYILIFVLLFPVAKGINYVSNDEWVYYGLVNNFAHGDFTLYPHIGATFYLMGFMAVLFLNGFGIQSIPVLTLLVSLLSVLVFNIILVKIFNKKSVDSLIFTALLFFNPIFFYSMWGFMTENYFMLFFLTSLYFYLSAFKLLKFKDDKKVFIYLSFGNLFSIFGYFVRQVSLITILSTSVFLLVYVIMRRKSLSNTYFKFPVFQFVVFGLVTAYHFYLFPKTPEMLENNFNFSNIFYFRYMFSLFFIVGIYVCFSCLPLVVLYIKKYLAKPNRLLLVAFPLVLAASLFYFKPTIQWRSNFYYMRNVLQRKGFVVENLHGDKFSFYGYSELYVLLDIASKALLVFFVLILLFKLKPDFLLIYPIIYVVVLSLSSSGFDRYLLPIFAIGILFFAGELRENLILNHKLVIFVFILSLFYYSYNFSADYILTNRYVWNKALELNNISKVPKGNITATIDWNYINENTKSKPVYKFTYDGPKTKQYMNNNQYTLVDAYKITYPLSFWINPYIYMYRINY